MALFSFWKVATEDYNYEKINEYCLNKVLENLLFQDYFITDVYDLVFLIHVLFVLS